MASMTSAITPRCTSSTNTPAERIRMDRPFMLARPMARLLARRVTATLVPAKRQDNDKARGLAPKQKTVRNVPHGFLLEGLPGQSGTRADHVTGDADTVIFRLLSGGRFGALRSLFTTVEHFNFFQLFKRLFHSGAGCIKLRFQIQG